MNMPAHDYIGPGRGPRGHRLPRTVQKILVVAGTNGKHRLVYDDDAQLRGRGTVQALGHPINLCRRYFAVLVSSWPRGVNADHQHVFPFEYGLQILTEGALIVGVRREYAGGEIEERSVVVSGAGTDGRRRGQ